MVADTLAECFWMEPVHLILSLLSPSKISLWLGSLPGSCRGGSFWGGWAVWHHGQQWWDGRSGGKHSRKISLQKKEKQETQRYGACFPEDSEFCLGVSCCLFSMSLFKCIFFNTIKCIVPVIVSDSLLFQDSKIDSNIYNTLLFLNSARDTHIHTLTYIHIYIFRYICIHMCVYVYILQRFSNLCFKRIF